MSTSTAPPNEDKLAIKQEEYIQTLAQLYRQLSEQRVKLLYREQPRAKRRYKRLSNEITSLIEEMMRSRESMEVEKEEEDTEEIAVSPE
jgi:septal ring factor EnvC (AmiA/AmiB activator)